MTPVVNQGGKASEVVAISVVAKHAHPWRMLEKNSPFVGEQMFFPKNGFQVFGVLASFALARQKPLWHENEANPSSCVGVE